MMVKWAGFGARKARVLIPDSPLQPDSITSHMTYIEAQLTSLSFLLSLH